MRIYIQTPLEVLEEIELDVIGQYTSTRAYERFKEMFLNINYIDNGEGGWQLGLGNSYYLDCDKYGVVTLNYGDI